MLNQNSNNDPDYVMCPLYKTVIPIADCIDLQEVSGGFIKPRILPDEILKIMKTIDNPLAHLKRCAFLVER